jgi:hypothetical protein
MTRLPKVEAVETAAELIYRLITSLKRGANEKSAVSGIRLGFELG